MIIKSFFQSDNLKILEWNILSEILRIKTNNVTIPPNIILTPVLRLNLTVAVVCKLEVYNMV